MPAPKTRQPVRDLAPRDTAETRRHRAAPREERQAVAGKAAQTPDPWLTVNEICEELKISRRTFDRWRALGTGPRCEPLGGHGPLRSRRSWLDAWAENRPDAA
jgi:predicted DNA-binding transcriptional regulator AlpA